MNIEELIAANTAALTENTAALKAVLAAGGAPTNVVPIAETPKPKAGRPAKAAPAPEPEEAPIPESDRPTKVPVTETKAEEFSDPLDPSTTVVVPGTVTIDPDKMISEITETWKTMLTAADADRKTLLKDKFPELRTKWGLAEGAKLSTIRDTPEKLVGLLEDIKAL
jgi:hypothetical protein